MEGNGEGEYASKKFDARVQRSAVIAATWSGRLQNFERTRLLLVLNLHVRPALALNGECAVSLALPPFCVMNTTLWSVFPRSD